VSVGKRAAARGRGIGVLIVDKCYWRDIGSPASLAALHYDLLDGTAALEVPAGLHVDRAGKRCFHVSLPEDRREGVGGYAWVEAAELPRGCRIARSVVYPGAAIEPSGMIENRIVTPFCEVYCGP
jgi:NDP-sugar pyrophosphorylase family protein